MGARFGWVGALGLFLALAGSGVLAEAQSLGVTGSVPAARQWVRRDGAVPDRRAFCAMAYDPLRERVVLFAGTASGVLDDTWDWDGASWTSRPSGTRPPARRAHAAAYDPASSSTLLFGGDDLLSTLSDTWQLPSNSPPAVTAEFARGSGNQTVLAATASDPDGDPLTFQWLQTFGPAVTLQGATSASASFVRTVPPSYGFLVVASDGRGGRAFAQGAVINRPPGGVSISAPTTQVAPGSTVTLTGSASDPDNDTLAYSWVITSRPPGGTQIPLNLGPNQRQLGSNVSGLYTILLSDRSILRPIWPSTPSATSTSPTWATAAFEESESTASSQQLPATERLNRLETRDLPPPPGSAVPRRSPSRWTTSFTSRTVSITTFAGSISSAASSPSSPALACPASPATGAPPPTLRSTVRAAC